MKYYLPNREEAFDMTVERLGEAKAHFTAQELIDTYMPSLEKLPDDIYKYIFDVAETTTKKKDEGVLEKIELVASIYHTLIRIASCVSESNLINYCVHELLDEFDSNFPETLPVINVGITINREGILTTKSNQFFDFITNNKIEGYRIRLCPICSKIFWATRLDKRTCSKACGNILRQRIWQEENKDDYNKKRRGNYAYKKQIKNKKEKNNGTL